MPLSMDSPLHFQATVERSFPKDQYPVSFRYVPRGFHRHGFERDGFLLSGYIILLLLNPVLLHPHLPSSVTASPEVEDQDAWSWGLAWQQQ